MGELIGPRAHFFLFGQGGVIWQKENIPLLGRHVPAEKFVKPLNDFTMRHQVWVRLLCLGFAHAG